MFFSSPRQLVVLITFLFMVTTNALAHIIPLNNQTTGEILNRFPTYFTPAGYVFSIWILIYVLLGIFTIYQGQAGQRDNKRLTRGAYLLSLANVINGIWIFAWHFEQFTLSVILMISILLLLVATHKIMCAVDEKTTRMWRVCIQAPISVYLGWISVATVVNVSVVLLANSWYGFGISPEVWSAIMIVLVTVITFIVLVTTSDWLFAAVVVWAFVGLRNNFPEVPVVAITALVSAIIIVLATFVSSQSRKRVTVPDVI